MNFYYILDMAGIKQICVLPFPLSIQIPGKQFYALLSETEAYELYVKESIPYIIFEETETINRPPAGAVAVSERFYAKENDHDVVYFSFDREKDIYAKTVWGENSIEKVIYTAKGKYELGFSNILTDVLSIEMQLLLNGGFLLHCCFVEWNKSAILFTAPSGTGKSTQGDLWAEYEHAKIINGDRAALIKENNKWKAYGLPYAGSSNIYKNQSAPIKAIVYLSQGKKNKIERMSASGVFKGVYPEIMIHRWDEKHVERGITLLGDVIENIPIYQLTCLPEKSAVECLKKVLV